MGAWAGKPCEQCSTYAQERDRAIAGRDSARRELADERAKVALLTSENEDYQRWQNEHEPDKCESSRAELAREVERLQGLLRGVYEDSDEALKHLDMGELDASGESVRSGMLKIVAALGAGKETR